MSALGDEDVRRLDVAMNDAFRMSRIQRIRNLDSQRQNLLGFHRSACNLVPQREAVQKLHSDEGLPSLLSNFIDCADIGMVEGRRRLSLSLESGQCLRVFGDIIGQELQRYESVQRYVLSLVDHTHPAVAELLDDPIVGDGLADHGLVQW